MRQLLLIWSSCCISHVRINKKGRGGEGWENSVNFPCFVLFRFSECRTLLLLFVLLFWFCNYFLFRCAVCLLHQMKLFMFLKYVCFLVYFWLWFLFWFICFKWVSFLHCLLAFVNKSLPVYLFCWAYLLVCLPFLIVCSSICLLTSSYLFCLFANVCLSSQCSLFPIKRLHRILFHIF